MTHHVVMFSGGITSWATARLVADAHPGDRVTLLFADTLIEDEDLYRFNADVADDLGIPVTRVADGRNPFEVFHDRRYLGNTRKAPCSEYLKQRVCRAWMTEHTDPADTTVYVGIDWTETHRLAAVRSGWAPWPVLAPLTEPPYLDKDELLAQARERGLEPPRLYGLGFAHNNCGGTCVRAGRAQWSKVLDEFPERYAWAEDQENGLRDYLGKDVSILRDRRGGTLRPLTLTAFREHVQTGQPVDITDVGGCGCFVD